MAVETMSVNRIALQNRFLGQGKTVYDALAQLYAAQGHISDTDIRRLAEEHDLPPVLVRTTAKFYPELAHDRPVEHVVKLCNGEACRVAGAEALERRFREAIDGAAAEAVCVESVTCLGYCGRGPNAMIDGDPVSLAEPEAVERALRLAMTGESHGLAEPSNPVYPPSEGKPCILMRHFDREVTPIDDARTTGIYAALEKAVTSMAPEAVLDEIDRSGLRGRGGAGFPTGRKLRTVAAAPSEGGRRFVVANFDEGDAGAYIDKELVERDPHTLIEGILLAAYACGAREAYVYARYEYPKARAILETALREAREAGLVGAPLFGSDFACAVRLVVGQGAYVCGEETSLLRSIEGLPAFVSVRPPYPAEKGLWGCPTAVQNVETLHNLSWIVAHGGDAYAGFGHRDSRGTKAVSLNGRVRRPGMYEVEFGTTLREILFDLAGGMAEGRRFKAVQIGGPLGGILPERLLDTPLDFESLAEVNGILGHGGIVVYSETDDLVQIARGLFAFCAVESCGKCFPCRIGSVRGVELFDRMIEDGVTDARLALLADLCETMEYGSLCALGGMIPTPIRCLVEYFPEELARYRQ